MKPHENHQKCLRIAKEASTIQTTLKRMIVGNVFLVEVQIRLALEMMAKM
jgi:hypothetical protein